MCSDSIGFFGAVINTMISKISSDVKHEHNQSHPQCLLKSWGTMIMQIGNDDARSKGSVLRWHVVEILEILHILQKPSLFY